jgi:hypothetical protein
VVGDRRQERGVNRHFHVIHNEARSLPASARAFLDLLNDTGGRAAARDRSVSRRTRTASRSIQRARRKSQQRTGSAP